MKIPSQWLTNASETNQATHGEGRPPNHMKQRIPCNYLTDVAGEQIGGLEMYKYGLPYRNAWGFIYPTDQDLVDLMLIAVERFPELHVVSCIVDQGFVNRYEEGNSVWCYQLHRGGSKDPDLAFTETWDDTLPEHDQSAERKIRAGCLANPEANLSKLQKMAVNFGLQQIVYGKKKTP